MLKLNLAHSLVDHDSAQYNDLLSQFVAHKTSLLAKQQGFIDLPQDHDLAYKIKEFADGIKDRFSHIVLLGIGGSSLGPKVLIDALYTQQTKHVTILENVDPFEIHNLFERLPLSSTLFLAVTKSGGTPETMAQFLYVREKLRVVGLEPQKHIVCITDPEKGLLRQIVTENKYVSFPIPSNVGGRYSVLSSVGLVLASLLDIDIFELLEGGGNIASEIHQNEATESLAYQYAITQYMLYQSGKTVNVLMPYSSRLRTFGNWYAQLLAESIGKNSDVGLTPVASIGTTDQHSLLQLFKEGPRDKLISFVEIVDHGITINIPQNSYPELGYLNHHTFNDLMAAELAGTKQSLTNAQVANATLTIDTVNPYSLGEMIMFFELATAFLGELFGVDAFNQPGVEESKILAKEILSSK
jgi:glucose-6-phosphate isomerase